jgi:hypothetical protein
MDRRLQAGGVMGEALSLYRDQAGLLVPLGFWIFLTGAVLKALAGDEITLLVPAAVVALILGTLYEGIVISRVRDLRDGKRDFPVGDLAREVLPVLPGMIAALIALIVLVFLGLLLFVVPGLYLVTIWAVVLPAIVIERRGVLAAFGRSRQLVRGNGWPVLGVILLTLLIVIGASVVLTGLVEGLVEGDLLRGVFIAIATAITAPISGLVTTVLYFRLLTIGDEEPSVLQ